jgi:hypothetical protein
MKHAPEKGRLSLRPSNRWLGKTVTAVILFKQKYLLDHTAELE